MPRATFAALIALLALPAAGAPPAVCDAQLSPPPGDPNGYKLRGDRCEGVYIKEVAGSASLAVVSLTESFANFDPASAAPLRVEWQAPAGSSPVHLRAVALRRRTYYRMDTIRPSGSGSYSWNPGILAALGLTRADIGVVGWVTRQIGPESRDVYLPLRIAQGGGEAGGEYQLVLYPGAELSEVYTTLSPVDSQGRSGRPLFEGKPLGYGYYPAERGVPVPVSGLKGAGLYLFEIGATLRDGAPSTSQLWFFHSGK
ncbi:MAG TPA: hypothetical protein VFA33_07875 [Bryobacteraceae bacterium]|nr:hypothetical protein [Bryobacteraceae bacterium]